MDSEPVSKPRRRRGRPRKNIQHAHPISINHNSQPEQFASKRKQFFDPSSDDVQIVECMNGLDDFNKKQKTDDSQRTRSQPHRAARFTDSYGGSPDVVVLSDDNKNEDESESDSDSDCSPMPSPIMPKRTQEEEEHRILTIQNLKKQLAHEEMKLVLLRKLKESQKTKESVKETDINVVPSRPNIMHKETTATEKPTSTAGILPSKHLLSSSKYVMRQQQIKRQDVTAPSTSSAVQKPSQSVQKPIKVEANSQSRNVPSSNAVVSQKQFGFNQFPLLKNLSNQITVTAVPATTSASSSSSTAPKREEKQHDAEALSQRQAAAKLALRKQLEKTLLQIPLPKRPPFKLNFFPNGNCIEFLCLLGLDVAVDFITKTRVFRSGNNPLTCSQCKTDFTSMWKWKEIEKHGKKEYHVYCEACISSNMRKALKAEHTNNLKSAFLKALQQEKEIDRLSQTLAKTHQAEIHTSSKSQKVPAPAHQSKPTSSAHHIPKTSTSNPHIPKGGVTMSHIPKHGADMAHNSLAQQVAKLNPQLQALIQAQAQHLLASGVPLHPNILSLSSFIPQVPHLSRGKPATSQSELRRQYRSDRVQSPSIPQAKASWHA